MPNQIELRYQVNTHSSDAMLLEYIKAKGTEFKKDQKILWALSAFWSPLACRWSKQYSEAELRDIAHNAIYELQKQIDYLSRAFGIEQELGAPSLSNKPCVSSEGGASADGKATFTTSPKGYSSNEVAATSTGLPELMPPYDDDDILNQNL